MCRVCGDAGLSITREKFYSFAGVPVNEIFKALCTEQNRDDIDIDELMQKKRAFVVERRKMQKPGRIDCVCEIIEANYGKIPMAIASSGIKSHVLEGLEENGVLQYFDVVVTHEDVASGRNKPAPDIFLLAAEKLGIEPVLCRGFEDADAGMEALIAAGMDACDVRKMEAYPHKF